MACGPNISSYDAWYVAVAVAEELGAPLATLDTRLVKAAGPNCQFIHLEASDLLKQLLQFVFPDLRH